MKLEELEKLLREMDSNLPQSRTDLICALYKAAPALIEIAKAAIKLSSCIDCCDKNDEPVSGYIAEDNEKLMEALQKLEEVKL